MNNLTHVIDEVIKSAVNDYINRIASEFDGIDKDDLHILWAEVVKECKTQKKSPSKSKTVQEGGCPYKFQRGPTTGEVCMAPPKTGSNYCSRHKKYEGKESKEKKVLPTPKKNIKPSKGSGSPAPKKVDRVFKIHNATKKFWHPETGLVIKSPSDRVVIGRIDNDKVVPLRDEDIDECKKWSFAFISSQEEEVKEKEEEEEVEEEEEEEEVEEEEEEEEEEVEDKSVDNPTVEMEAPSSSGGKFWNCKVEGTKMTTVYGKIGSKGRETTKDFKSHKDAVKAFEKEKASKLKKEYVEKPSKLNKKEEKPSKLNKKEEKPSKLNKKEEKPSKLNKKEEKPSKLNKKEEKATKAVSKSKKSVEEVITEMDSDSEDEIDSVEKHVSKALGVDSDSDSEGELSD